MITNIPNLGMNYLNYRTSIVQKHHVQLLGWPAGIPFANPHQLTTTAAARELQKALTVSTCKWVTLSKRQRQEHAAALEVDIEGGQSIGKKRKQRSDKGKKRKHTMATNDDKEDQEDEDDEDDNQENERPGPTKKHKSAASTKRSTATGNKSKAAGTSSKSKVTPSAAKKASRIMGTLPPAAPKSNEYIDTEEESDG